jgi:type I site-specific restriction endonuclease
MADPLSTIAGVASLTDVAVRLVHEVFKLIASLKHASADLEHLYDEAEGLRNILEEIRSLTQAYSGRMFQSSSDRTFTSIKKVLDACIKDLNKLQVLLGTKITESDSVVRHGVKIVKSVLNKQKIAEILLRLEAHKTSMSNALSLLGRYAHLLHFRGTPIHGH